MNSPIAAHARGERVPGSTARSCLSAWVNFVAALLGFALFANGVFMLIDPMKWYLAVPGVTTTGQFNQHFLRDIGLIFLFLGGAFVGGWLLPGRRVSLWACATAWLSAHALFHFWEVAAGICGPPALARDFPDVTLPALVGITLTILAWRSRRRSTPAESFQAY